MTSNFSQAVDLLRASSSIAVLSGAGLSQASGIPTYREADGLWSSEANLKFSTAQGIEKDPKGFRSFWKARARLLKDAKPNAGHKALVALSASRKVTHITQNVDGLLTAAGAQDVLELHGSFRRWRCDHCTRKKGPWPLSRCMRCFKPARPDVVMFGESLDPKVLTAAQVASVDSDAFLLVGSSALVYPAADLPVRALRSGRKFITLNAGPLLLDHAADVVLRGNAEELLPQLVAAL